MILKMLDAVAPLARAGDLGPKMLSARRNLADRLSGRGRTARCSTRKTRPASSVSRTPVGPAVKSRRWLCLSTNLMDLRVGTNTNRYGAAGWRTLLQGGAKAPRHPSTPRGLSVSRRRRGSTPSRPAGLALELLFERRHGPPLFRDLQDLLLNEWIARHLGEFFAFARLVAVLVGLAFRHRIVPKNLDGA